MCGDRFGDSVPKRNQLGWDSAAHDALAKLLTRQSPVFRVHPGHPGTALQTQFGGPSAWVPVLNACACSAWFFDVCLDQSIPHVKCVVMSLVQCAKPCPRAPLPPALGMQLRERWHFRGCNVCELTFPGSSLCVPQRCAASLKVEGECLVLGSKSAQKSCARANAHLRE